MGAAGGGRHSFIWSQRPSCVGLTTPGMWAPFVMSSQDSSAYLLFGSGSGRGEGEGAKVAQARAGVARVEGAPPRLQDHDHQQ